MGAMTPVALSRPPPNKTSASTMSKPPGHSLNRIPPSKPPLTATKPPGSYTEFKLRVPKNLVKRYNIMRVKAPRPIKFNEIKEANMLRKSKKQVFAEEDLPAMPTHGAGSVYNYERKEEARKKRRGYTERKINTDDLPYALRLGGKGGKRYTGKKEPNQVNASYFVLTQSPDGVFEAVPVQAWYNFLPDIDYATLSAEEVEHEFSKRSRALQDFNEKYNFGMNFGMGMGMEEQAHSSSGVKIQHSDAGRGLQIHDDEIDMDGDDDADYDSDDDKPKTKQTKKEKDIFRGKKKGGEDGDSDEEETVENAESKEVDYMSESSSEDELLEMDDEPDPEKDNAGKAKDDLNLFMDSEDDEEKELDEAGKELKAMLKKEAGEDSSSGDDDEEDDEEEVDEDNIDNASSAVFMQGKDTTKKKKGRSGSNPSSKSGSRSNTPIQVDQGANETLSQAAMLLKEGKVGAKRPHEKATPSPESKKQRLTDSPKTVAENVRTSSPSVRPGTPSDSGNGITEEAVRRYLMHKPMTTTDLMRKFRPKCKGMSKEQTVNAIASILKKIQYTQEKIDGKLFLSIKTKK